MALQVINENFENLCTNSYMCASVDVYSAQIVPVLFYLDLPQDIKILWYDGFGSAALPQQIWEPPVAVAQINESDVDLVIIPLSDHTYFLTQEHVDYINSLAKPHLILSWAANGSFTYLGVINNLRWVFFPYWLSVYPVGSGVRIPNELVATCTDRKYVFSCINGHPAASRLINLAWMTKNYHIFTKENSIITCALTDRYDTKSVFNSTVNKMRSQWPEGAATLSEKIIPQLPLQHPEVSVIDRFDLSTYNDFMSCDGAAFTDTYINIIIESESNGPFVSEKSLKPIIAGQLFVTTAAPGTLDTLRLLGFDTFDDIIEHSRYSEYRNVFARLKALHLLLAELVNRDWKEIYRSTHSRRMKNRELLLSGSISQRYFQNLERAINECIL